MNSQQPENNTEKTAARGDLMKVGELARRTGLTRQAVHSYVQLGLLRPAGATQGGQRLFDKDAEHRVKLIRKLCATGYTLKDIREIFIRER